MTTTSVATITGKQTDSECGLLRLRLCLFFILLAFGLLRSFAARHVMDADGIDYLDMSDAYFRGDWAAAINGLWSPLYSWIIGAAIYIFKPSPNWEFPVVHLANFAILAIMLASFDWFLLKWTEHKRITEAREGSSGTGLPQWAWVVLGYTMIGYASFEWMTMEDVGPDHLVAASIFIASGLLLRMQSRSGIFQWALFGLSLGLGYLAKSPMFVIAILFFVLASAYGQPRKRTAGYLTIAIACFLILAAPLIMALSAAKGRLTFSDSGKLNYSWHVNGVPLAHWRSAVVDNIGSGDAKHPTRKINDDPAAYEFASPIRATYPVSYDPSYWEDGLQPHFNLRQQLSSLKNNIAVLLSMLFQISALIICLSMLIYAGSGTSFWQKSDPACGLLAISAIVVTMFLLVHLEPRYIAPVLVVAFLVVFGSIRMPRGSESDKLIAGSILGLAILFCVFESVQTYVALRQDSRIANNEQWVVAQELSQMGLRQGDRVANIGNSYVAYWARMSRLSVIAEVPEIETEKFWHSSPETQSKILAAMTNAGARIVVTESLPAYNPSWHRIKDTKYYFYKPYP